MKGSAARLLCAAVLCVAVTVSLADKPRKNLKKFPPPGPPFIPPLPLPEVPPWGLAPVTQAPSTIDPYACLPKYLCIIKNKKGEKRTTIVHGLHPAIRKAKPNVVDPSTLPKFPGIKKPFPVSQVVTEGSDDEIYRDREFNDSFLKQQEMAEAMAFLEEKRRQFMYQQGLPKQKVIPKGGEQPEDDDDDKKSKESNEDEEKSQEVSKEEEKEEDTDKSVEISKEEEKEESAEEDSSEKSRSKLSKYKIKKKLFSQKRNGSFKARINDYEDADMLEDHLATVPWDDRLRNDSDPLKPKEIYDKLFGKVLPAFQIPKIAKSIPGMSSLFSGLVDEPTTTTTQRPGLFKRMLRRVSPLRRYKRDATEKLRLISDDLAVVKQIKDPARQCRMIFKGCDLPYGHIMKMVSTGQVLIESDVFDTPTTKKPTPVDPAFAQDDEQEQAVKDKMAQKNKSPKPIPQMLAAQASLGGKKKVNGPGGLPIFGKNKKKPMLGGSSEEFSDHFRPKPKKRVASLPLLPMRYQWGKPTYNANGRPTEGISDFSGGIVERSTYKPPPPPTTTTSTTPRPIFAAAPLDKRDKLATPPLKHSVIKLNKTHAVHILSKKPYNPPKIRTKDEKGQPVSFSSAFTEIAGQTGGIHDFFDRISGAFGGDGRESGRELSSTFPGSGSDVHGNQEKFPVSPHAKPTAFPSNPIPPDHVMDKEEAGQSAERDDEDSGSEEDQEENEEENNDEENNEENDNEDENNEEENEDENNEENEEEIDEDDVNDELADELDAASAGIIKPKKPKQPNSQASLPENEQSNENEKSQEQVEPQSQEQGDAQSQEQILDNQNKKKNPSKNKKPGQQEEPEKEEEDEESEEEENDEEEMNLPDNVPEFIRQSMIEDYKRKKLEKQQGGAGGGGQQQQGAGGPGGQGGYQQQGQGGGYGQQYGRPGQSTPSKVGGFLSSLFARS